MLPYQRKKVRAGRDFDAVRENLPRTAYGPGQHLEAELRKYILRQFGVFVREARALGLEGIWHVDRVEAEAREFLRLSAIDAKSSKGHDNSGRAFGRDWISNWDGSIQPSVMRLFERSVEWQHFQQVLVEVAESQTPGGPNPAANSPELQVEEATYNSASLGSTGGVDSDGVPPRTVAGTPLGRNLERLRKECGWSFDEIAVTTELDKKLILGHINKVKQLHPRTLATYARAFTEKLGRPITVADLER